MKNNILIWIVLVAVASIFAIYARNFYPIYGFNLSGKSEVWGQFGDYIGGTLNPILSFTSIFLLIKSISLQNDANLDLKRQLENSEKTEKFRSFNSLFFNLIESQRVLLTELIIDFGPAGSPIKLQGAAAIIQLENEVEYFRAHGFTEAQVGKYVENLDENDQIFGLLRSFYIIVRMICEKLDNANGFSERERREQILTLINLTDFSHLRLILMGIQFLNYQSTAYLKSNFVFLGAADEAELEVGKY